jgi:nitroreductase
MNKVIETIMKRRSVRLYESKPISKETLQMLIDAGNAAPTGGNAQNWRFVVVEDKSFKNKLMSLAVPRYKKWMEKAPKALADIRQEIDKTVSDPIYYDAPAVIFVIGSGMTSDLDTPMVCQNIMLAARSMDIGSCWVYFGQLPIDDQEVRNTLKLQEGEKVYGPILIGYPKDDKFPEPPDKKPSMVTWI